MLTDADRAASVRTAGDPVVFLHGLFETPDIWEGLLDRQGALMPETANLPLPGHTATHSLARTDWLLKDDRFLEVYARHLRQRFDGRRVRLVGHSTGGLVALRLALAYPELVSDIFLVSALFHGESIVKSRTLARMLGLPVIGSISARLVHRASLSRPDTFQRYCGTVQANPTDPMPVPESMREGLLACPPLSLARIVQWLGAQQIVDRFGELNLPVTAVVGARDPVLPADHQLDLLGRLPNAQATLMDTGHLPFIESPRNFDRSFLGWLYSPASARKGTDDGHDHADADENRKDLDGTG